MWTMIRRLFLRPELEMLKLIIRRISSESFRLLMILKKEQSFIFKISECSSTVSTPLVCKTYTINFRKFSLYELKSIKLEFLVKITKNCIFKHSSDQICIQHQIGRFLGTDKMEWKNFAYTTKLTVNKKRSVNREIGWSNKKNPIYLWPK